MPVARPWYSSDGVYARLRAQQPRLIKPLAASLGRVHRVSCKASLDAANDPTILPTGPEYTRFESLMLPGDVRSDGTMPVTDIMNRAPDGTILTFGEGVFADRDFNALGTACIFVPKKIRGIIGSGKGTLGGSTGTIFSIKPMSSTKAYPAKMPSGQYYVPPQGNSQPINLHVMKAIDPFYAGTWKNFQVRGTDQGHNFCGFQIYQAPGCYMENVLSTGWQGDAGAPPGECFGFQFNSRGVIIVHNVEVDGRRQLGGIAYGASGMTFQNSIGALFDRVNAHHCRTAQVVFYQCFNCTIQDSVIDAASAGAQGIGNGSMNSERTAGCKMIRCQIIARSRAVHISHSNDTWTLTRDGVTYTTAGGILVIIDPNPVNGNPFGNGYLYIQTWAPYQLGTFGTGDSMSYPGSVSPARDGIDTSPFVFLSTGPGIAYVWSYGKNWILNLPNALPERRRDKAAYEMTLAA